jgi:hypothetical protein
MISPNAEKGDELNRNYLLAGDQHTVVWEIAELDSGEVIAIAEALQEIDEHSPLCARKV